MTSMHFSNYLVRSLSLTVATVLGGGLGLACDLGRGSLGVEPGEETSTGDTGPGSVGQTSTAPKATEGTSGGKPPGSATESRSTSSGPESTSTVGRVPPDETSTTGDGSSTTGEPQVAPLPPGERVADFSGRMFEVGDTFVYVCDDGQLYRAPKDGSAPSLAGPFAECDRAITVAGPYVYTLTSNLIRRYQPPSRFPTQVTDRAEPQEVASFGLRSDEIFWVVSDAGNVGSWEGIRRNRLSGGTSTLVPDVGDVTPGGYFALVGDPVTDLVYSRRSDWWIGEIRRLSLVGGASAVLAKTHWTGRIAVSGATVVWADMAPTDSTGVPTGPAAIRAVELDGTHERVLGEGHWMDLRTDALHAYWTNIPYVTGQLMPRAIGVYRRRIDASAPAEHLLESVAVRAFNLDDTHLYYTTDEGTFRIPKP